MFNFFVCHATDIRCTVHLHATAHSRAFCLQHAGRAVLFLVAGRQTFFTRASFCFVLRVCAGLLVGGKQALKASCCAAAAPPMGLFHPIVFYLS